MMETAIAITVAALAAWDIGRRYLAGIRKAERAEAEKLAADVAALRSEQEQHTQSLLRHDRALTDLRGTRVEPRRPHLTGVGRS